MAVEVTTVTAPLPGSAMVPESRVGPGRLEPDDRYDVMIRIRRGVPVT